MDRPFRYPNQVPVHRAVAIRELVLQKDSDQAWSVVKLWVKEEGIVSVLQDAAMVMECNGVDAHDQASTLNKWFPLMKGK